MQIGIILVEVVKMQDMFALFSPSKSAIKMPTSNYTFEGRIKFSPTWLLVVVDRI